ncbi:hypothetical protein An09g04740 [Aspergillus niger]|uniref:Uncharacterized protein n=2 Tax=Aspergillus niger TaxID=5061 RepID=A2QU85_ASPNC|nr:hypothetical protein An09g04740 [Aspergillus niger]CAK40328.1 hypothetical protein An09g04740 [Aspergillus niger]
MVDLTINQIEELVQSTEENGTYHTTYYINQLLLHPAIPFTTTSSYPTKKRRIQATTYHIKPDPYYQVSKNRSPSSLKFLIHSPTGILNCKFTTIRPSLMTLFSGWISECINLEDEMNADNVR